MMAFNANSPLQRALYGGQPGRRNRYQQYYQDQQQPDEQPVAVPEAPPEEPTPVAQSMMPMPQQAQQPQQGAFKNSWQRQGGPIDQLFGGAPEPEAAPAVGQPRKSWLPQPAQEQVPFSRAYDADGSALKQLMSSMSPMQSATQAAPRTPDAGAPNPQTPLQQALYNPQPTPAPQSDFQRGLTTLYSTLLGRTPGPEDFAAYQHIQNDPNAIAIIGNSIRQSPEFQQRQASGAPAIAPPPAAGAPGAPPPEGMVQGRGFGSHGGDWVNFNYNPNAAPVGNFTNQLEGFDPAKLDPNHPDANTMKYVFARAASGVDVFSPNATQQVVDRLRAMGVNAAVENADGEADRIIFLDTGESIDVMRGGANVGPAGWQWIDPTYGGVPSPQEGGPQGGPGPGVQGPDSTLDPLAQALVGQGIEPGTQLWDMLMAQLKQQTGAAAPEQPAPDQFRF